MLKKLSIFLIACIIPVLGSAIPQQATLQGSSGLVTVPSGDVVGHRTILIGSWFTMSSSELGIFPRLLLGIYDFELGGAVDIQNKASGIINAKYRLYNDGVKVGFGGNFQINNAEGRETWTNEQFYLAFTWSGWAETTAMLGKTFGKFRSDYMFDFGIGIDKTVLSGSAGSLGFVLDFSNYDYRNHRASIDGVGNEARGIFNFGLRIKLFSNKINIDAIAADLLDGHPEGIVSAAFNTKF